MHALNPFSLQVFLSFAICLVIFYLLGSFILGRLNNPFASIGAKLAFGGLAAVSLLATIHAQQHTGLLFYLLLFGWMAWSNRFRPDFSDLKEAGPASLAILVGLAVVMLSLEAYRSNLMADGLIYVGNSDVSFYSSYGHNMYFSGYETNPENRTPDMRGMVYHFGDLWFSGMYSNLFKILPYYSYHVLFRVYGMFALLLVVFGWCKELTGKAGVSLLVAAMTLGAVYIELFNLPDTGISAFELFSSVYPMYGLGSHLVVALLVIPMSKYMEEKNWALGMAGLLLTPFLNAGLLLVPILTMLVIISAHVILGRSVDTRMDFSWKQLFVLLVVSAIPITYYVAQRRLDSGEESVLTVRFVYLVFHTLTRAILSQGMVVPYLFGLLYFWNNGKEEGKRMALVQVAFFLATLVAFAGIFPQVQGNSIQILSMHFQAFLAPVCMIGLSSLIFTTERKTIQRIATVFLLLITAQNVRVCIGSSAYRSAFDWESYIPGYKGRSTISVDEWKALHSNLGKNQTTFGYFICDSTESAGSHYTEFTYLKSVLPGAVFQRMNPLPADTTFSHEMQGYYYRTSLGYFTKKNSHDFVKAEMEHMEFLKPDYLLLPKGSNKYCIPERHSHRLALVSETEKFMIYEY